MRMAQPRGTFEKVDIEHVTEAKSPVPSRNNDTINVQEPVQPALEPAEMCAIIVVVLLEGQKKGSAWFNKGRHARRRDHPIKLLSR